MKKKELTALLTAVAGGIAVWQLISDDEKWKEREQGTNDSCAKSGLTKEKLKKYLFHLFQLCNDREKGSGDSMEAWQCVQEAEDYAESLYSYIKKNMKTIFKMEGDDGFGNEPFNMTDELFYLPACRIYGEPLELVHDNFVFEWGQELWMLEDGQFAVTDYINFEKGAWSLTCRIVDRFVKEPDDIPFCLEDLELEFGDILEKMEEDKTALEKE